MKTDLLLLLDQCVQLDLVNAIRAHRSIRAKWVNDESEALAGADDNALIRVAKSENRILVTVEGRINEKKFKICTHPGIIVFRAKKQHDAVRTEIFRSFMQSGHRSRAYKAVTYLKVDGVTFKEQRDDGTTAETYLPWHHIKRHPHRGKTNFCDYQRTQPSI